MHRPINAYCEKHKDSVGGAFCHRCGKPLTHIPAEPNPTYVELREQLRLAREEAASEERWADQYKKERDRLAKTLEHHVEATDNNLADMADKLVAAQDRIEELERTLRLQEEPLPCPFCRGDANWQGDWMHCIECGVGFRADSYTEALDLWNRRGG